MVLNAYDSFELALYDGMHIYAIEEFKNVKINHLADFETRQTPQKACFCLFLLVRDFTSIIWIERVIL